MEDTIVGLVKMGSTFYVRLPPELRKELEIDENTNFWIFVRKGEIVLTKVER